MFARFRYKLFLRLAKAALDLRQFLFLQLFLNRRKGDLVRADLSFLDLRGADLSNGNLREATLIRADLSGVNLRGANLLEADLQQADLREADLTYALVTDQQLAAAGSLQGAVLPDGSVHGEQG